MCKFTLKILIKLLKLQILPIFLNFSVFLFEKNFLLDQDLHSKWKRIRIHSPAAKAAKFCPLAYYNFFSILAVLANYHGSKFFSIANYRDFFQDVARIYHNIQWKFFVWKISFKNKCFTDKNVTENSPLPV